jgi:hypothetical protein
LYWIPAAQLPLLLVTEAVYAVWLYKMKPYYKPSLYKSEIAFSLLQCASFGAMTVATFTGDAALTLFVVLMLCQTAAMCAFVGFHAKHVLKFARELSTAWRTRHERTPPQEAMAHSVLVSMKSLQYVRVIGGKAKLWTSHFQLRNLLLTGRIYESAAGKPQASRASDGYVPTVSRALDRYATRDRESLMRTSMSAWASASLLETSTEGLSIIRSVPTRLRTIDSLAVPGERLSTMSLKVPRDSLRPSISAESKADMQRSLLIAAQPREASKPAHLPALPRAAPSYPPQQSLDEDLTLNEEEEEEDLPVDAVYVLKASADVLPPEKLTAKDRLLIEDSTQLPALPLAAPSYPVQQSLDEDPALSEVDEEEEEEDQLIEAGKGDDEAGEEEASADLVAPKAEDELILDDYMLVDDKEARDEWQVI